MNFASDNAAGAHPAILKAIEAANEGYAGSYGGDRWSKALDEALEAWFGRKVFAFPVATGGAANALALAQLAPPWSAVFGHRESHINVDECGAPEFYTGGAKLVALDGPAAKFDAAALAATLKDHPRGNVHRVQPGAVSLTQASECGTIYRPDEIRAIVSVARNADIMVHMDGARIANALVTLGCPPADITWKAGIDALSLGFTKNGAIAAEAVVFFDEGLAQDFGYRRKRGGHLFSKMRFFAAQLLAMLEGGLWRALAGDANANARALGDALSALGHPPAFPVEANEVFVEMPVALAAGLRADGVGFHPWGTEDGERALYRFVCSFATKAVDIDAFVNRFKFHLQGI